MAALSTVEGIHPSYPCRTCNHYHCNQKCEEVITSETVEWILVQKTRRVTRIEPEEVEEEEFRQLSDEEYSDTEPGLEYPSNSPFCGPPQWVTSEVTKTRAAWGYVPVERTIYKTVEEDEPYSEYEQQTISTNEPCGCEACLCSSWDARMQQLLIPPLMQYIDSTANNQPSSLQSATGTLLFATPNRETSITTQKTNRLTAEQLAYVMAVFKLHTLVNDNAEKVKKFWEALGLTDKIIAKIAEKSFFIGGSFVGTLIYGQFLTITDCLGIGVVSIIFDYFLNREEEVYFNASRIKKIANSILQNVGVSALGKGIGLGLRWGVFKLFAF